MAAPGRGLRRGLVGPLRGCRYVGHQRLACRAAPERRSVFALYGLNGALNAGWTAVFFAAHRPGLATADSGALLATTIALIARTRRHSRTAAITLVPYAAWVGFATALSGEIARRN